MCGKTLHAPRVPVGVLLGVVRTCCTGSLGTHSLTNTRARSVLYCTPYIHFSLFLLSYIFSTGELYVASD